LQGVLKTSLIIIRESSLVLVVKAKIKLEHDPWSLSIPLAHGREKEGS